MLQDNNTITIVTDKPWRLERCGREGQNYIFEDLLYMTRHLEPGLWHLQILLVVHILSLTMFFIRTCNIDSIPCDVSATWCIPKCTQSIPDNASRVNVQHEWFETAVNFYRFFLWAIEEVKQRDQFGGENIVPHK